MGINAGYSMNLLFLMLIGIAFGLFTGIVPGIHSNTLISVLQGFGIDESMLALLIISLYPAHLIASFIPAVFFGVPDESTVVSVLPGQRMVRQGKGISALNTVILSSLFAVLISTAVFLFALDFFPAAYSVIKPFMKYILGVLAFLLIIRTKKPLYSMMIFLLAGMLGYFSLNSGMEDPFLPLFTGMFAMGAILTYKKGKMPEQRDEKMDFSFIKYSFFGVVLGMLADLVPGVSSPSQVAALASIAIPFSTVAYLATISAIAVSEAMFSLATAATIEKSRIGATAVLSEIMDVGANLELLLPLFIISISATAGIVYFFRKRIAGLARIDFSAFNIILAAYLASLSLIIDGTTGIIVFILGSALGWLTIRMGVERTTLMAAVILPTLLLLFGIFF